MEELDGAVPDHFPVGGCAVGVWKEPAGTRKREPKPENEVRGRTPSHVASNVWESQVTEHSI